MPYLRGMELAAGRDETFFTPERSSRKERCSTTADGSRQGAVQAGKSRPS